MGPDINWEWALATKYQRAVVLVARAMSLAEFMMRLKSEMRDES
jgi:hypothetical protein